MYLRMLKRDIKDKVALNIVLFIFMIISSTLLVMSTGFIYSFISGINKTYEKCNSSDVIFAVNRSIDNNERQQKKISEVLSKYPEIGEILISDVIERSSARVEFDGVDRRNISGLYYSTFVFSKVSHEQNVPYNLSDETFTLTDGTVAIPQRIANETKSKPGDSIRITTDAGNIYELKVAYIYKDPSSNMLNRLLFSDSDFETLKNEFYGLSDFYEIKLKKPFSSLGELQKWGWSINDELQALSRYGEIDGFIAGATSAKTNTATDAALISLIISIFMVIMGVSLILLIFMAIRFSLRATIKREEKEIGTMKAIGVDSLSYKTLFIVKYIAFAVFGAILGSVFGIPLCRYMISKFIINTINPGTDILVILSIISGGSFIFLMVAFSFIALRRMKKISVMDTIHGENRGERFKSLPGVFLHKSKKMSVPFFLAMEDITGRLKRYINLVISYTLGITILFTILQLKTTIVNDQFRRTYWNTADRELMIRPDDNIRDKLSEQEGSYRNVFLYYEKYFNENGIPLNIQIMDEQEASIITPEKNLGIILHFGDYDIDKLTIVKGGKAPKLSNEVVVSHYMADTEGIKLGDTITLEYKVYKEDGFQTETVRKDYLVTAFVEAFGSNGHVFLNDPDTNIFYDDWDVFNEGLDCSDSEYDTYIEKMRSLKPEYEIWDKNQTLDFDLGREFGTILDLLFIITLIILSITIFAMTFLYQSIFIHEEASDIAMLKSLGVGNGSIRKWHYDRILILVAVSGVMALVMSFTLVIFIFDRIGRIALLVKSFKLLAPPVWSIFSIPIGLALLVTVVLLISFKSMDSIKIWKIRNE